MRIVFLNSHPIQYFAPLYTYLNRDREFEVTGLYLSDISLRGGHDTGFGQDVKWDVDLLSGYRSIIVGSRGSNRVPGGFFSLVAPELWTEICSGRYDALVLHGHNYAANHVALAAAKRSGMPVMMRCDTHLALDRGGTKQLLRKPLLGAFYRLFDGFLAIGSANAAFYRAMGVPERKIFHVPFSVDNARFMAAAKLDAGARQRVRYELGITDDLPAILFAAKFQPHKRPDDLLRAAALLTSEGLRFHVVMTGSGRMECELRDLAAELALPRVTFPGFFNQSRLPEVYAACDVFVIPSDNEPWGLAVNEAMCAGLPVVAAESVGCSVDLVRPGMNGATFPARDAGALAASLRPILKDEKLRRRLSAKSREIISGWSYAECLHGLRAAVHSLRSGAPR